MLTERRFHVDAPTDAVWAVLSDVERWPEWTDSITSLQLLEPGDLRIGARAKIKQPSIPPVVWTVTELDPGRYFVWRASGLMPTVGVHRVEPDGDGSMVTLSVEQSGIFSLLAAWWLRRINNKYLDMEMNGLKRRVEGR